VWDSYLFVWLACYCVAVMDGQAKQFSVEYMGRCGNNVSDCLLVPGPFGVLLSPA
jgi:hypothetical protein